MKRTLIVGDLHGCADELRRLLDRCSPDRVVLVGDVFARGPDPVGCWRILRDLGAEGVLGNHDARMLEIWDEPPHGNHTRTIRKLAAEAGVREWLAALPLFLEGDGWLCVHAGLHPLLGRAGTTREQALTIRRWPDDTNPAHPFWWERMPHVVGAPLVVYGHDALRRVVDRRPWSLGLDAGCVYGGHLAGWLAEEDRVVQVAARPSNEGSHPR